MDIDILKDKLFDLLNESDLPICEIETDDIQSTMKIATEDGRHFLVSLDEIQWQKIIHLEPEPIFQQEQLRLDYLKELQRQTENIE